MKTSLLARGLLAVGITTMLGCQLTLGDLQARNPAAATLKVHCRPWQIPEKVNLFAVRSSMDHIVTDETQSELFDFAQDASVFIEVNALAI